MSRDLFERLVEYRSDLESAIAAHRDEARVVPIEPLPPAMRRRSIAVGAAAVLIVGGLVIAVAVNRDRDPEQSGGSVDSVSSTMPDSTTTPVSTDESTPAGRPADWDWLAQFGTESTPPAVPTGWKTMDFEDLRFAVPAEWMVPVSRSCAASSTGLVLVSTTVGSNATCHPENPLPPSVLNIEPADAGRAGTPVRVGTLPATQIDDPGCVDCSPSYVFENGYQVTVSGPEAGRVLATFTDAGIRRVLQAGTEADTTDWQRVHYEGITVSVPFAWTVQDLPASNFDRVEPDGKELAGGLVDPGMCGGAMFRSDVEPSVFLGTSRFVPSCAAWIEFDLAPNDGLWMRTITEGEATTVGTPVAHADVPGVDVTVVHVDRMNGSSPSPVLDMIVRTASRTIWVTLGVDADVSIARSILRSIQGG